MLRRFALALMLASAFIAATRPTVVHAHSQAVHIAVSRNGFNDSVLYMIDIEAGHEVTITFTYADDDMAEDNAHEVKITGAGLDLPTVRVSKDNPVATITFTPTKTGKLRIICILPCVGMENLVGGLLKVEKPKATGKLVLLALDLTPREDGSILARVTLMDKNQAPLEGKPVIFSLRTSVGGDLVLATPTTMENGSAVVKIPASAGKVVSVKAEFEGGDGLAYAVASNEIEASGQPLEYRPGPLSSPAPPPSLALLFLILLGGIWITYGYVAYQATRFRHD